MMCPFRNGNQGDNHAPLATIEVSESVVKLITQFDPPLSGAPLLLQRLVRLLVATALSS
jgi:hypothetical protein